MRKAKLLILFTILLIISACNQGKRNLESNSEEDSTLKRIRQSLSVMPTLSRKNYLIIDRIVKAPINHKRITRFQTLNEASIAADEFKSIESLLEMELGLGIQELLKIDEKNYSFLSQDRRYFSVSEGIGLFEKYVSRKTNSTVNGFIIYINDKEYYSYHVSDTINIDMKIIGSSNNLSEIDLLYELVKDSLVVSASGLGFRNDTIIRYSFK